MIRFVSVIVYPVEIPFTLVVLSWVRDYPVPTQRVTFHKVMDFAFHEQAYTCLVSLGHLQRFGRFNLLLEGFMTK